MNLSWMERWRQRLVLNGGALFCQEQKSEENWATNRKSNIERRESGGGINQDTNDNNKRLRDGAVGERHIRDHSAHFLSHILKKQEMNGVVNQWIEMDGIVPLCLNPSLVPPLPSNAYEPCQTTQKLCLEITAKSIVFESTTNFLSSVPVADIEPKVEVDRSENWVEYDGCIVRWRKFEK